MEGGGDGSNMTFTQSGLLLFDVWVMRLCFRYSLVLIANDRRLLFMLCLLTPCLS